MRKHLLLLCILEMWGHTSVILFILIRQGPPTEEAEREIGIYLAILKVQFPELGHKFRKIIATLLKTEDETFYLTHTSEPRCNRMLFPLSTFYKMAFEPLGSKQCGVKSLWRGAAQVWKKKKGIRKEIWGRTSVILFILIRQDSSHLVKT